MIFIIFMINYYLRCAIVDDNKIFHPQAMNFLFFKMIDWLRPKEKKTMKCDVTK